MTKFIYPLCLFAMFVFRAFGAEPQDNFTPPPITVPEGYTVELAAAPPLVKHPMMAGFDDRGRLFVAESAGLNLPRAELEKQLPNFVRMLEDTDGDGRFDKSTIFADKMTLPMGALWRDGALYVAAPPNVWRLEDTDNDGVADQRTEIVDQFGYSGNAASVHGCFESPNGRLYWCDGRHGHEFRNAKGQITSQGKAARIFSCLPDGADRRIHCGGGMDNPVEVDFTEEGEMLGTVNILFRQRGDCLVHWMHGGVYPRYDQQAVVAEFARTGDLLPPVLNLGHVAVSGMTRCRSEYLDPALRDQIFVTEFNTHQVVRVSLERNGSTFSAQKHPFLHSSSGDFHPTDVLEDPDGSLLVIDTGGWFRIGCPTSQVAKPNILGAIYRIRRKDGLTLADPRGQRIHWESATAAQLARLLDDSRFAVRERAITELARRQDQAIPSLATALQSPIERTRRNAAWALCRIGSTAAKTQIREALQDPSPSVRQAAAHAAGEMHDREAVDSLSTMILQGEPPVRREAATALGKIGESKAVPALLAGLEGENDRMLEHALVYALIEINAPQETVMGLSNLNPNVRRGALIALDQMPQHALTREMVAPLLDTEDYALQNAALEVIQRREGWGKELIAIVEKLLALPEVKPQQAAMIRGALIALSNTPEVQQLVAEKTADAHVPATARGLLLEVIGRSRVRPVPEAWIKALQHAIADKNTKTTRQAVSAAVWLKDSRLDQALRDVAADASQPSDLRIAALEARTEVGTLDKSLMSVLTKALQDNVQPMEKLRAARVLGDAQLTEKQLLTAADLVASAGPLELDALLKAFEQTNDQTVGSRLASALQKAPGNTSLSAQRVNELFARYPKIVQNEAANLMEKLQKALGDQAARLDELAKSTTSGDAALGKAVFHSSRASCIACHRIGPEGGRIGPDLSKVGQRRTRRDLLEAIALPSASFARGFESYSVLTADGTVAAGLIVRETPDYLHIRTSKQQDLRVPREEIEAINPHTVSIMPSGLENTLTRKELADLLSYLQSLK